MLALEDDIENKSSIQSIMFIMATGKRGNFNSRKFHQEGNPIMLHRCNLCGAETETIDHLFLHCRVTDQLWKTSISLRESGCPHQESPGSLACWNRDGNLSGHRTRWNCPKLVSVIWWIVWKERNQRCFGDNSSSIQRLKMNSLVLFLFLVWTRIPSRSRITNDLWDSRL